MLRELAELTMLDEGDPQSFRVRAYESAAQSIAAQATDLGKLTVAELQKIEGIGKSTAEKVRELLETGKVAKLEGLRAKHPPAVVSMLRIQGLGPKALKRLRSELGVESLDDLKRALDSHQLRELKGFGPKSEENLARALSRLEEQGPVDRTPVSVALPLANRIVAALAELPGGRACVDLRLAATILGDGGRRRHPGGGDRSRAGHGRGGEALRGRPRARPWQLEDQHRHPARHAGRRAGGGPRAARGGAALLHRLERAQHQASPAGAGPRPDAQRVRPGEAGQRRGRRAGDGGTDLRGARAAVHPAPAARGCRRDRGGRSGNASAADWKAVGRLSRPHGSFGRRSLAPGGGGGRCPPARLSGLGAHRPRRGDAVGREPGNAARPARTDPRPQCRARRCAHAASRGGAEHRPRGTARLRPRNSAGPSTGAWLPCTIVSISIERPRPGGS